MKRSISTVLTICAVTGMLGALMLASPEAAARGGSSRGGGHSAGAHSHSAGASGRVSGYRGGSYSRGARVGVFVGAPIVASPWWYYNDPYYAVGPYYYPPAVPLAEQPSEYVEQPAPQAQQYWYYCQDSKAYYPYVQTCASSWQRVVPYPTQ